jgi:hypothetical protein
LVGGGERRFSGVVHLLGGDQAVGMTPTNAVRYGDGHCCVANENDALACAY